MAEFINVKYAFVKFITFHRIFFEKKPSINGTIEDIKTEILHKSKISLNKIQNISNITTFSSYSFVLTDKPPNTV